MSFGVFLIIIAVIIGAGGPAKFLSNIIRLIKRYIPLILIGIAVFYFL